MSNGKLSFLRTILRPLGLSDDAINRTIEFVSDLLFEKDQKSSSKIDYPYHLCVGSIPSYGLVMDSNIC